MFSLFTNMHTKYCPDTRQRNRLSAWLQSYFEATATPNLAEPHRCKLANLHRWDFIVQPDQSLLRILFIREIYLQESLEGNMCKQSQKAS